VPRRRHDDDLLYCSVVQPLRYKRNNVLLVFVFPPSVRERKKPSLGNGSRDIARDGDANDRLRYSAVRAAPWAQWLNGITTVALFTISVVVRVNMRVKCAAARLRNNITVAYRTADEPSTLYNIT